MSDNAKQCLVCEAGEDATPLVSLSYRGEALWVCPQHLPILIHSPDKLVGHLPGAENLKPADHHD
jgi:hypothetical protein